MQGGKLKAVHIGGGVANDRGSEKMLCRREGNRILCKKDASGADEV